MDENHKLFFNNNNNNNNTNNNNLFVEMLGLSSIFNIVPPPSLSSCLDDHNSNSNSSNNNNRSYYYDYYGSKQEDNPCLTGESSEVVNTPTPTTPNSVVSISSSFGEAEQVDNGYDDHKLVHQDKSHKPLKLKNEKQKKQKEARVAFKTKTEVDHLDDGYRWRKYGQKAVKNSPFPRSYYRCTTVTCGVKKRVERSCDDPSTVVTTYEGHHTHPCPMMARGGYGFGISSIFPKSYLLDQCSTSPATASLAGGTGATLSSSLVLPTPQPFQQNYNRYQHHSPQLQSYFQNNNTNYSSSIMNFTTSTGQFRRECTRTLDQRVQDDGLLQDIVTFHMQNDDQQANQDDR